jgi:hypothetical protein
MQPIQVEAVQQAIEQFLNEQVYVHLETTQGAYATHRNETAFSVGAFIRNGVIQFSRGLITGEGPYRVGLKLEFGWIYADGLTDWTLTEKDQLLLAGHDREGKLAIALQFSKEPF